MLTAAFAASLSIASANAGTFTVYTGYADNLRPTGFFPSPWLGDSNVVSQSSAAQSFDSGAVRFLNTGSSAITISNFTVTMNGGSGATFSIWSSLTIGAGKNGIFAQTSSYNFDSSDYSTSSPAGGISGGSPGSNGIGGCSSTAAAQASAGITSFCAGRQPIVAFDENGKHFMLSDTGHILDTGNYDFVNGSTDGNESIKWNVIGSGASRGGGGTVPEASVWMMMVGGFGLVGASVRRRKLTVTA